MTLLTVNDLSKRFSDRTLFDGVSLAISEGERLGIVGVNGSGKSTLLKMLGGLEPMDSGILALRRGAKVGYLDQEPILEPGRTIREEGRRALADHEAVLEAHQRVSAQLGEAGADHDRLMNELDRLTVEIEQRGGWESDHRLEAMLTPLGLVDLERSVDGLSGGERKRLALGKVLLEAPDLLLLDEPTNHLDAETVDWLEGYLPSYRGAVILITHDRLFLDRVVTRILEVAEGGLIGYPGSYEAYISGKAERLAQAQDRKDKRLNLLRTELEWLRRGPKARGTKSQSRIDRAVAMRDTKEITDEASADLFFAPPKRLGKSILKASHLHYEIGGRTLIGDFSIELKAGDRVGILGPNGAGKTTLLRLLLEKIKPQGGTVVRGLNSTISYFDQMRGELDENLTVTQTLCEDNHWVTVAGERVHVVTYLNRFLFAPDTHRMPVGMLSGGERNRLILARMMAEGSNVIVLDEPTNDLDLLTLQSLELALVQFPGCVLVVTHDRSFLNKVANRIVAFGGQGDVTTYEGNYDIYKRLKKASVDLAKEASNQAKKAQKSEADASRKGSKSKAKKAKLGFKEKRELEGLPAQIEALETEQGQVETELGDPEVYKGGGDKVATLTSRLSTLETELGHAYARWEALDALAEGA